MVCWSYLAEGSDEAESKWQKVSDDYTEYPYPLGEARLIPKVIPVNLSTISVAERDDAQILFKAKPSALLFEKMRPEDRLLTAEQLDVEFSVDRSTERISRLSLLLSEKAKVHWAVRITDLRFDFEFEDDPSVGRNVLKRVQHYMRGRVGWVFRPNFSLTTDLEYGSCSRTPSDSSYLYASRAHIEQLR